MALDLPPPATPQPAPLAEVQRGDSTGTLTYAAYTLHVGGDRLLSNTALQAAVEGAPTLSDAVRNLARAHTLAGYPAARISYALSGADLYLHVSAGAVAKVEAPENLAPYFSGIEQAQPLTVNEFETRRVLADLHAERTGVSATSAFEDETLRITPVESGLETFRLNAEVGNPGNRFSGRWFVDASGRVTDRHADEFRVQVRKSLNGLNSDPFSEDYQEGQIGISRVTPWGVLGGGLRVLDYRFDLSSLGIEEVERFDGSEIVGEISLFKPLWADYQTRLTGYAKLDRTRSRADPLEASEDVVPFYELYNSAELGGIYARTRPFFGGRLESELSLSARIGLADEALQHSFAQGDYQLARMSFNNRYHWGDTNRLSLELSAQWTEDTLPLQSQWVLGGWGNLTAFLPGSVSGDRGALGRIQAERRFTVWDTPLTARVFAETAFSEYSEEIEFTTIQATDAGVSLEAKLNNWCTLSLAFAEPLSGNELAELIEDVVDANLYGKLAFNFQ